MKCPHCGGSLIPEPGDYMNEPALKCMSCGRRVKMEQMRECRKCKKEYPLTAEYFHRMGDGFVYYCKPCRSEMQKGYKRKGKVSSVVPVPNKNQRVVKTRVAKPIKRSVDLPKPVIIRATPEQIIGDLRRGFAIELIAMIQEKYGL
jgi:hypothetical protein